jgi:uncharacterized protein YyaL (SSP411 family)
VNRLEAESSPYLRQHAGNPVDWFPWGEEAFAAARERDVPIFLSVGYASCHWCHVMAHESFEDDAVADVLNGAFVSVKVDREERPDIDAVYMEALLAVAGSGGWPMSVFLLPDGRPFFAGTYFPPDDGPGRPSFRTVLAAVTDLWAHHRDEVERQAGQLVDAVRAGVRAPVDGGPAGDPAPQADPVATAVADLARRFDETWGGFGGPPKFPQPLLIELCLVHAWRSGDERSSAMALATLRALAGGGIHDHVRGGFARYATDRRWRVPHFEKMLYDQAGLTRAFLHGWLLTSDPDLRVALDGIVDYTLGDLAVPGGGLASSEDADSDGREGAFYTWTPAQVGEALDGEAGAATRAACRFWGVTPEGDLDGASVLHRPPDEPLRGDAGIEASRHRLRAARERRPRPGLDDKVLLEWNAMFVGALAEAAAATGTARWGEAAVRLGEFLWRELRRPSDGRLLRTWQTDTGARQPAFAADHAWMVDCCTRLAELTGEARWLDRAVACADALLDHFADTDGGGFFTTPDDGDVLVVRPKDLADGALASANGAAAQALVRLGTLTGADRFLAAARRVVDLLSPVLASRPSAVPAVALAADLLASGTCEIVITGDRLDLVEVARTRWIPDGVLAWGEPQGTPLWDGRSGDQAFVCRGGACQLPTADPVELAAQLDARTARPAVAAAAVPAHAADGTPARGAGA